MDGEGPSLYSTVGTISTKANSDLPQNFSKTSMSTDWQTSTTLLRQLRRQPTDEAAWAAFVARYGRLIARWCRQWGLQESDAEDVTQNVLLELAKQIRTFEYDRNGSFRGWLRTVAQRSWSRFVQARQRAGVPTTEPLFETLAEEQLLEQLEKESDQELLELAMRRVRSRVQPHTWEAFRLLALEQQSGAAVAEALQMTLGAVFVARSKVQKMLRLEIERLNADEG